MGTIYAAWYEGTNCGWNYKFGYVENIVDISDPVPENGEFVLSIGLNVVFAARCPRPDTAIECFRTCVSKYIKDPDTDVAYVSLEYIKASLARSAKLMIETTAILTDYELNRDNQPPDEDGPCEYYNEKGERCEPFDEF